jgi:hypothetical protein
VADFFEKSIDGVAFYQQNHLTCWAAVALTAYRAKFGKTTRSTSLYNFFNGEAGAPYKTMVEFAEEIKNRMDEKGSNLEGAKAAVVAANPRFRGVPDGLSTHGAEPLFRNFLHMQVTRLVDGKPTQKGLIGSDDKNAIKALIKAKSPLVVFTSRSGLNGHLRLVHGYWDGGDAMSPQIMLWDPEGPLNAIDARDSSAAEEGNYPAFAKSRLLWPHFQQQIVERLQRGEIYHY